MELHSNLEESTDVISSFFSADDIPISVKFLDIIDELNYLLEHLKLPKKIQCVYNPTLYARHTFEMYVRKYCNTKKHIMYFGMNPGPWGMSQTGVPFGEISSVRDWLQIQGPVQKPPHEIPTRPVKGFDCTRTEISGKRFWGLFKDICGTPENFFSTSFVYNYLPQQWMSNNGSNLTPGDFKIPEMQEMFDVCDPIFVKVLKLYDVKTIVAIGKFCEGRAQKALRRYFPDNSIKITTQFIYWAFKMTELMMRALELAKEALTAQEVPVGCVFTVNGKIVAESRNTVNLTRNPTRHAEINCIDIVIEYCNKNNIDHTSYFKDVSVHVTVEPCIMCAAALNSLGVKEVVYGCANDRFGGKTVLDISNFYDHSYSLTGNLLADEAMSLLKQFYKGTNPNAPESKIKKKKDII